MDNPEHITVLSLCTGYGGLDLGLHRAIGRPMRVVAVEIEAFAAANLVAKTEEGELAIEALYTDLRSFPAERFRGCFDWLIAGFPCQPFSVAGKRKSSADQRYLWPDIIRIIKTVRPVRVLLENVPGLLSSRILDNRPDLVEYLASLDEASRKSYGRDRWYIQQHRERLTKYLLKTEGVEALAGIYYQLRDMGYTVEAGLFTASEVGAPHKRQRLFALADSRGFHGRAHAEGRNCDAQAGSAGETVGNAVEIGLGRITRRRAGTESADGHIRAAELADASGQRIQRDEPERCNQPERPTDELCDDRWPAGPGQEQHDWEEPRTVEPGVGRTAYGPPCRVDRLRLLGNGIVPAQAEKAIKELLK